MIKKVPTNDVEILLQAKSAGDYGFFQIGSMGRTPEQEYRACEEIVSQIKRHVEGVGWTYIQQNHVYETEDGEQYESLYEALEHLFDAEGCSSVYEVRYVRPSDQGVGTRRRPKSFEELIETAYLNPHSFEVVSGQLSPEQQKFLNRVLEASLPKEATPNAQ
ncbi:hypothetical protein J19TS2_31210 [Cohnella xylanilytica]|uniref:hypothetical protein n=1 Tax=Cohnella xylanilytica TaxID=557555 RepID=UPI001B22D3BE|nr:hypothetical protein [Cohnella xylanilytica]GIO13566.1 hypothetical protein J19TS2_31210 [Cohnella xylanilytica]